MDIKKQVHLFMIVLVCAASGCGPNSKKTEKKQQQDAETPAAETSVKTEQKTLSPARDWTLTDINDRSHSLSSYRGRVVMLNFFATWCPHCVTEIPELNKIHQSYGKDDFVLLAVNVQESRGKVSQFIDSKKIKYTVLLDSKSDVARAYGVRGIPTNALIDKKGALRFIDHMVPDSERIESLIAE